MDDPAGQVFVYERRKAPRQGVAIHGRLVRLAAGGLESTPVQVIDVSPNGIGIICKATVIKGQHVEIKLSGIILFGEIRHADFDGRYFHAGIAVNTVIEKRSQDTNELRISEELPAFL